VKKLDHQDYTEIAAWMHRNARELELALWRFYFENGSSDAVLDALLPYQNRDGGFGQQLEPDNWNPASSPYTSLYGINQLRGIGFTDMEHPVFQGVIEFLGNTDLCDQQGWFFSIPSNDTWPHAPWWTYSAKTNVAENFGLTAELCGFILRFTKSGSALYTKAESYTAGISEILNTREDFGDMGLGGLIALSDDIEQAGLTQRFNLGGLKENVWELAGRSIERDSEKWKYYTVRPSRYIRSPETPYYASHAELIEKELDYLIDTRLSDGVWDIPWSWFDNDALYPKEFAISENWWKGITAIQHMLFLKAFGRLDNSGWIIHIDKRPMIAIL
jgi:hypothetical protein